MAPLHVVHGAGDQVTWREEGERAEKRKKSESPGIFFQGFLLVREEQCSKPACIITVYPEAAGGGGNCHPDAQQQFRLLHFQSH